MTVRRMLVAVFAVALVAGCANSPTSTVELRRATPAAAFDEAPPPPSATGGINGLGSGT